MAEAYYIGVVVHQPEQSLPRKEAGDNVRKTS